MKTAKVIRTEDLGYKKGFVECKRCGWHKDLGDGFDGYHITNCPRCTTELQTYSRRKVTYGRRNNLTVELGRHTYFVLSNGIHVRCRARVYSTHTGLSERRADAL